jgi:hypothetical protein
MALVVEDGTGLATANSYVSLVDCAAYHVDRNNTSWALASEAVRTAALIKAAAYIDGKYISRFRGWKASADQALQWPRAGGIDPAGYEIESDELPAELVAAACEAALLALTVDLSSVLDRGGLVQSQSVGPISQTFFPGAPADATYRTIEYKLRPLLQSAGVKVERG